MESNYVKSARIKLLKLGITDYESFKKHKHEMFEIIDEAVWKEYERKMRESLPDHIDLGTPIPFTVTTSIPKQPCWGVQPLEYYTRSTKIY